MRRLLTASIALIALTATASAAVVPRFLAGDVTVTVAYTGKGKVDDTHEILVSCSTSRTRARAASRWRSR